MDNRLQQVLEGKEENYIFPFLWLRGEPPEVVAEEIEKIYDAGIRAFCVESRRHPDFCGPLWWRDMDAILAKAKQMNMRVWLLDDSHFPTGYANGGIQKRPELRKIYLAERHMDVRGPLAGAACRIDEQLKTLDFASMNLKADPEDRILRVLAAPRRSQDVFDVPQDVTRFVQNGVLHWDIPEGDWRVFILVETKNGGGNPDYINPLDAASVRVLIDEVYEPHFARYAACFGNNFAGFFSDEPGFGNASGYDFNLRVGMGGLSLPWSREMPDIMEEALGADGLNGLPALWYPCGERTHEVRYRYMNSITDLYARNFSMQLGEWCRAHGVEYTGHVIEDNNVHARLGCGPGHFFRSMAGQDMAGVDIIGPQILPGMDNGTYSHGWNQPDGEFFHYALTKLGASLGHIDPRKKGRAMCEIFGAYGWAEGIKLMKWLTDHALVRGINLFVPHAFSPTEFPDGDCPPHFYARGQNPQYRYFGILMRYMNRMCHLLNGGKHMADAALLYHAEAEWSGDCMLLQKPARALLTHQIDFDILPDDVFKQPDYFGTQIRDGKLSVNGQDYRCLIVPYNQYLPSASYDFICGAAKNGFPVYFVGGLPDGLCGGEKGADVRTELQKLVGCRQVTLEQLADALNKEGLCELIAQENNAYLRSYHYRRDDGDVYLFFNEHPDRALKTSVRLQTDRNFCVYDGFSNVLRHLDGIRDDSGLTVTLTLSPYESVTLVESVEGAVFEANPEILEDQATEITEPWDISVSETTHPLSFRSFRMQSTVLRNLTAPGSLPKFAGTIRYDTKFRCDEGEKTGILDLGSVYETAEVWVNGQSAGVRICPPYRFDLKGLIRPGANSLTVDVTTTLAHKISDGFSVSLPMEPSGLLGPVRIIQTR